MLIKHNIFVMMKKETSRTLDELLTYFPAISPPLTLSGNIVKSFSAKNPPIPGKLIDKLFSRWEEFDEFTEIVPCFQLEPIGDFFIIVYWKGGLLSYEFVLMTLNNKAGVMAKKVIAGTLSNNQSVMESVAVIDDDLNIFTVVGEIAPDERAYNPENSTSYRFEILPDGQISSTKEDDE